jgi:hypothetical protein
VHETDIKMGTSFLRINTYQHTSLITEPKDSTPVIPKPATAHVPEPVISSIHPTAYLFNTHFNISLQLFFLPNGCFSREFLPKFLINFLSPPSELDCIS